MPDPQVSSNGSSSNGSRATHDRPGLARRRAAEAAMGALEREEARLDERARVLLGVAGRSERIPLGSALRASGTGWYPLIALCALGFGDAAVTRAVAEVTPAVRVSIGGGALGALGAFGPAFFAGASVAALIGLAGRPRRAAAGRAAAVAAGTGAFGAALSTSSVAVLVAALAAVVASGVSAVVVTPMLFDAHRPEVRVRAVAAYVGSVMAGIGAASLIVVIAGGAGLTWRSELLITALLPLAAAGGAGRLVDPRAGRLDRDRVRHIVEERLGGTGRTNAQMAEADTALKLAEQFRRAVAPKAAPALLVLAAAYGMFSRALPPFFDELLRDRWGLAAPSRGLAYGLLCVVSLPALIWFGRRGEVAFRMAPRLLLGLARSVTIVTAAALGAAAMFPAFGLCVALLAVAFAGFAVMLVTAIAGMLTLNDPSRRGHAAALVGATVVVGGLAGQSILTTIGSRFGVGWALIVAAVAALAAGTQLTKAVAAVDGDVDALVGRMIEIDELATRVTQGQHLPLLSCRHVEFSYGQVQVLFDVSFTVDDGEMVALLGTNGAGKSTLLRVISGLTFPSSGSIHYRGADITFLDTDRRVQLGISQIPGGRAVFGAMSVVDNLRAFGHTCSRDRARLERGIDEAFDAFPRLAQRRNQLASTLSGGEQQMLALGKAFILQPRLLLIDELSLGLAPIVVSELLGMVRRINDAGTAVVLVEQSVNIALSIVDHAYFMEKGQIRFDGVADDLLARPDLLRSVFLKGATAGLGMELTS